MNVEIVDDQGNDILAHEVAAPTMPPLPPGLPPSRVRDGETRGQCWERLRREARTAGMRRRDAVTYAGLEVDRIYPTPEPPAPEPDPPVEPEPVVEPDPPPAVEAEPPVAPATPAAATESGLAGLGDLPAEWPTLPANAALAVEVAWVQANRLRVVQGGTVDLSRSLSPAPSYAALAWLETSILFPAKWADVTLRATQDAQDDQADVRREKVALAEVRALMAEASSATL